MLDARKLQHQSHFTWQSRCAPRSVGDDLPPSSWRERALKHRELCPVLQGQRPAKPSRVDLVEAGSKESAVEKNLDIFQSESLPFYSAVPPEKLMDDDGDGDSTGALCRVELSRYIARRSAMLAREAEISRRQHSDAFSANICESDDWTTECPGAHAADTMSLKDTAAWTTVLDAISFERAHLRRGSSNQWPDALWSPACLSSEAASSLEVQVTNFITHLDALADGSDAIRCGLHAMPIAVLLRQLLCDLRMATGDLRGAARVSWLMEFNIVQFFTLKRRIESCVLVAQSLSMYSVQITLA